MLTASTDQFNKIKHPEKELINPNDFINMLLHKDKRTDIVMISDIKKLNNRIVQDFYDLFLKDKELVEIEYAYRLWQVYYTGLLVQQTIEEEKKGTINHPTRDQFDYWYNILNTDDIEKLHKLGSNVIALAYGLVTNYCRYWTVNEQYQKIYKSKNPHDWIMLGLQQQKLIDGREMFCDMNKVVENCRAILGTQFTFTN